MVRGSKSNEMSIARAGPSYLVHDEKENSMLEAATAGDTNQVSLSPLPKPLATAPNLESDSQAMLPFTE